MAPVDVRLSAWDDPRGSTSGCGHGTTRAARARAARGLPHEGRATWGNAHVFPKNERLAMKRMASTAWPSTTMHYTHTHRGLTRPCRRRPQTRGRANPCAPHGLCPRRPRRACAAALPASHSPARPRHRRSRRRRWCVALCRATAPRTCHRLGSVHSSAVVRVQGRWLEATVHGRGRVARGQVVVRVALRARWEKG